MEFYNASLKGDELLLKYAVDFANGRINMRIIGSQKMLRF